MNLTKLGLRACSCSAAVLFAFCTFSAHAQTAPVAFKTSDISVFAGYQNLHPDYGTFRNNGFVVGADFTRYLAIRVDPSLEVRYNYATGKVGSEKSLEAGIRAQTDFKRFHPYLDLLGGVATVNFSRVYGNPTYTHSNGPTFSFGGGVDFDIYHNFQVKVDYQQQQMYFAQNITLTPRPLSVGLTYRIPFSPINK
jgi:opacity protein-like surface antigen